jgi:methyltransferase
LSSKFTTVELIITPVSPKKTSLPFFLLLLLLAGQRLLELRLSRRNEAQIVAAGGREHGAGHFWLMKLLHTSWFVAMVVEVLWFRRPFNKSLALIAAPLLLLGQTLRYAAIRTLGRRWSVRIMTLPGTPPIRHGIYHYLRHPNYLGVILEIAAVPLLHSAYLTALIFSLANALVLAIRIRAEEEALRGSRGAGERGSGGEGELKWSMVNCQWSMVNEPQ